MRMATVDVATQDPAAAQVTSKRPAGFAVPRRAPIAPKIVPRMPTAAGISTRRPGSGVRVPVMMRERQAGDEPRERAEDERDQALAEGPSFGPPVAQEPLRAACERRCGRAIGTPSRAHLLRSAIGTGGPERASGSMAGGAPRRSNPGSRAARPPQSTQSRVTNSQNASPASAP